MHQCRRQRKSARDGENRIAADRARARRRVLFPLSTPGVFLITRYDGVKKEAALNRALRNIMRAAIRQRLEWLAYRVYVLPKLIKACMCFVRGFARTAHTLQPPPTVHPPPTSHASRRYMYLYLAKPLTFSHLPPLPPLRDPCLSLFRISLTSPRLAQRQVQFKLYPDPAPPPPKAALRFFKVTRGSMAARPSPFIVSRRA